MNAKRFFRPPSVIVKTGTEQYPGGWNWQTYSKLLTNLQAEHDWRRTGVLLRGSEPLREAVYGLSYVLFPTAPTEVVFARGDMSASSSELIVTSIGQQLPLASLTKQQTSTFTTISLRIGSQVEKAASDWPLQFIQREAVMELACRIDDLAIEAPREQRISVAAACDAWLEGDLRASAHGSGLTGCLGESSARALERFFIQHQPEVCSLIGAVSKSNQNKDGSWGVEDDTD